MIYKIERIEPEKVGFLVIIDFKCTREELDKMLDGKLNLGD